MNPPLTDFLSQPIKGGKAGEAGDTGITNADFLAAIFTDIPTRAYAAVVSKKGDPKISGWIAQKAIETAHLLAQEHNNFMGCSSYYPGDDGSFKARKSNFAACHFLMLDDLGTKVPLERLGDFKLSWLIETSPNNFQGGILFSEPLTDSDEAVRLLNAVIDAGLCDAGARSPLTRWARLPVAINGKPEHMTDAEKPFQCRLIQFNPTTRYTPIEIVDLLKLKLAPIGLSKKKYSTDDQSFALHSTNQAIEVFMPRSDENPVLTALKAKNLYKTPLGSGKHDVTCPWVFEHTDSLDTGAAYFQPDEKFPVGGFCCQHSHSEKYNIKELLEFLNIRTIEARHKPVIRVVLGDLDLVVDAAEKELAKRGRHYQAGGLIVTVTTDPTSGDPAIAPSTAAALTRELSVAVTWEKHDQRKADWIRCDPPSRHVAILFDAQSFKYLPSLAGLARQPYFRELDGKLVTQPGYDHTSKIFSVFDARKFEMPEPTIEAAKSALKLLEDLLTEFRFLSPTDKAAALAAIFTAVVRTTLPHAPAFHVRAPVFGSGKTYLCELIGAFAGPGDNAKVSYPTTSEEATKVILSLLLTNPAVIEFDDMDSDWIPHGIIKRVLTAEHITDRILGVSKTATVSTRTLFLGSGNNVGPIRDLLRRVLTIHIDPRCSTPATIKYQDSPVEKVRKYRCEYICAVLTIIQAWISAGKPREKVDSIATYNGAWSEYCRHPLIWLGQPDPATALLDQIRHDPDAEALKSLLTIWCRNFGSTPVTVRKVINAAILNLDLKDAILELPTHDRGEINPSKFGWFLKKNANRIVGELEIQSTHADGRVAWKVVQVKTPLSPALPPLSSPFEETVNLVIEVEI